MRFIGLVALLTAAVASAEEPHEITVRVFVTAKLSDSLLSDAQQLASELYERIGIRIHWVRGDRQTLATVERQKPTRVTPGCASVHQIDMRIQSALQQRRTRILAEAYPFRTSGVRIQIPMRHVVLHSGSTGVPIRVVLGFVLAHEVGHILLGHDAHSSSGIMRAELGWKDMMRPLSDVPMFQAADMNHLQRNVKLSVAGCPVMVAAQ